LLSIVSPVYNEGANIGALMDQLARDVTVESEFVVVYDFDEDDTLPVIRAREATFPMPIRLLRNRYGRGAVNAVKTGLEASTTATATVVIMADLCDDLRDIDRMYGLIENDTFDVVCGSRYMKGGAQIAKPSLKAILSRLAGLSLHFVARVPTHDATNNFKMYRGAFIRATRIESRAGFEIGLELCAKAHVNGFRIGEVPTTWHDRVAGESRFDMRKWLPQYFRWYRHAFRRVAAPRRTA
jgi:glycosyltransferase involved in cell wall biosynthesis